MRAIVLGASVMAGVSTASAAAAQGDAMRGAEVYRVCVSCHALEPSLHLSGPSLGNIIGRAAGTADGYVRYSAGLAGAGFAWSAATLDGWLQDPAAMIPGTYMTFPGIDDPAARADLIAFLEVAGAPGGAERAVAEGLMPAAYLRAQAPDPIGDAPPSTRTTDIRHCGDSYFITTEDGRETPYWEKNVRLKIDSVETGPAAGVGVVLGAGMQGDRFTVIFTSVADLERILSESCEDPDSEEDEK